MRLRPLTETESRVAPWIAAGLSGLLYFAAYPGAVDAWSLAFVAFIPLIWACQQCSVKHAVLFGWVTGITAHLLGFLWLFPPLVRFTSTGVAVALFVGLSLYQGARCALASGVARFLTSRGWPAVVAWPTGFALSEAAYPLLLPFTLAATLHRIPVGMQLADLGGAPLVVAYILLVNTLLAELLKRRPNSPRPRIVAELFVSALAVAAYAWLRMSQVSSRIAAGEVVTVGLVQPPTFATRKQADPVAVTQQFIDTSNKALAQGPVDLLVWGETAVSMPVSAKHIEWVLRRRLRSAINTQLILGVVVAEDEGSTAGLYNTAVAMNATGAICARCRYDKQLLLPFGEYIPFAREFPGLNQWLRPAGTFERGSSAAILEVGTHQVTPIICNEVLSADYVRRQVSAQSAAIINLSSAAWFPNPAAGEIHLAQAQLRAIEHRRFLVMASTSGLGGVVDPLGRVANANGDVVMTAPIAWLEGSTMYSLLGDWPLLGLSGVLLLWKRRKCAAN